LHRLSFNFVEQFGQNADASSLVTFLLEIFFAPASSCKPASLLSCMSGKNIVSRRTATSADFDSLAGFGEKMIHIGRDIKSAGSGNPGMVHTLLLR
jgi:hypothetical protein